MLEMAQRQAQVDEVRWSRLQTELASSQNLSVMIFTTFTVIFLPLSFFTSLFGMNAAEWQGDQIPGLQMIGSIALPSSAFLILVSLIAAFSSRVQFMVKLVFKEVKSVFSSGHLYAKKLEPSRARQAKQRRQQEKREERRRQRERERKQKIYDLWAMIKMDRNTDYQIPDLNRRISRQTSVTSLRKKAPWST